MKGIRIVDSAAHLNKASRGMVAVCGSHGGMYAAWLAARSGVRAIVLNDAGIGKHSAGIAGVMWLAGLGIPAVAVDYRSARIGDGKDMMASGRISMVNDVAARHGCLPGHSTEEVTHCLLGGEDIPRAEVPEIGETRQKIANSGHREVWAIDSVTLTRPEDRRAIVLTGSHGGLIGGRADAFLDVDVFAAFFNDAGGGKDDAGFSRLPKLDERGVAAATVTCDSARIGDGRSTYDTGVLSRVNAMAQRLEIREGMSARDAVARLVGLG